MKLRLSIDHFWLLGILIFRAASGITANLAFGLATLHALRGRRQAVEALVLSFLFVNLNDALFPSASLSTLLRYAVVIAACVSVFLRAKGGHSFKLSAPLVAALLFSVFALFHSFLLSAVPTISALKVMSWILSFLAIVQGWQMLSDQDRQKLEERIFFLLATLVAISVFLSVRGEAYVPRTNLLRGLLNHSQALGAISVTMAVWSILRAAKSTKPKLVLLLVFAFSVVAILFSGTRTALVTLAVTLALVWVMSFFKVGRLRFSKLRGLNSYRFAAVCGLGILFLATQWQVIFAIMMKSTSFGDSQSIDLALLYADSRGELISQMWANIAADPLGGIGFGLASDPSQMEITYAWGVPIGALVEKGVTVVSIWEELGLVGLLLFVVMIISIFVRAINSEPEKVAVFITILMINFGEASLMSAGGIGLIQIVLIGWVVSGKPKIVKHAIPRRRPVIERTAYR